LLGPIAAEEFTFTRPWLRAEAARIADPRNPASVLARQLNLPPSYLLIHRVTLGTIGVLCQLGATAPFRAEVERWQPGFAEPGSDNATHAAHANRAGRPLPKAAPMVTKKREKPKAASNGTRSVKKKAGQKK
jgi:hypothetical protein